MKFFQPTIKQHFVRSNHKSARHSRINIFCATPSVLEEDEQRLLRQVLFSQKPDPTVVTKRNRGKALEKREITAATMVFSRESRAFKIVLMSVLLLSVVPRTAGLVTSQQFKHARIALLTERAESWVVNEESHIRPASKLRLSSALVERSKSPSFEERMRKLVAGKQRKDKEIAKKLPPNVKIVRTLEDYKRIVVGEKKRIVVVRFFAPWCKACKAVTPLFYRIARQCDNAVFVEVPVSEKTSTLHQGLGIQKLPFAHIYTPEGGLVEELRITRPFFPEFALKLQTYMVGMCELKNGDASSPYTEGAD